jgi:hypothetical protein
MKKTKFELNKDITQEEVDRVMLQRQFETIAPNSLTWQIALATDAVVTQMKQVKMTCEKRVLNVAQCTDRARRLTAQLATGIIKEQLRDDLTMNEDEMKTEIRHQRHVASTEALDAAFQLNKLRVYVGKHRLDGKVILTEDEYDEYCTSVLSDLKVMGFDVLA